jgi:GTP-binding protein of the ras superfamily involved in termination of M-phase
LIGDASVGKTTLMVKYVENKFDEVYIETLGVSFMEKTITLRNTDITFSLWDLGGRQEFLSMLPLVCNDSVAFFFIFDLSRKSTLLSIKEWYRQCRGLNKNAHVILIGNKYDIFTTLSVEEQEEITILAKKYAKAMKGSLIFSSSPYSINVQKIFKIAIAKIFDLKCTLEEIDKIGEPLCIFDLCKK